MKPLISIIIWTNSTHSVFFRECLLSILAQDYSDFEVVVLDENNGREASKVVEELMLDDPRLNFHKLKERKGPAYALNVGLHRKRGSYVFFMGQHDRLSKDALSRFAKEIKAHPEVEVIYSDRDELVGVQRMNPRLLPGFNVELLRHMNYIGDAVLFSLDGMKKVGLLNERLQSAAIYDLLLRAAEKKLVVRHISRLLYHVRVFGDILSPGRAKEVSQRIYREHMTVAITHLQRIGLKCRVTPDASGEYWRVHYDGSDAVSHRSEYRVVSQPGVAVRNAKIVERMYGILRQKDVGIVGARFEKWGFTIDNCGYIFDSKGLSYPACRNMSIFQKGYMNRAILPQDVSMVDPALFMIDMKVLDKVGGLDRRLSGRAQMLDLCLKVMRVGRRVVFDPAIVARKKRHREEAVGDLENAILCEKWKNVLAEGDVFYNSNLPMGMKNYRF